MVEGLEASSYGNVDKIFQDGVRELARELRDRQEAHLKVASESSWLSSKCSVAIAAATFSAAVASGVSHQHPQASLTGLTAVLTGISAFLILVRQAIQPGYHAAKHQALVEFYGGFMHRLERAAMSSFANHLADYSTRLVERVDELSSIFPLATPLILKNSLGDWRWRNIPERPTALDRCIFLRKIHMEIATWQTDCHAVYSIVMVAISIGSAILGAANSNRADGRPLQNINRIVAVLNVIVAIVMILGPAIITVTCPLQRPRRAGVSYVACNAAMEDMERSVSQNLSLLLDPPVLTVTRSSNQQSILIVSTPRGTSDKMDVSTRGSSGEVGVDATGALRPSMAESIDYLSKLHLRIDKLNSEFPPIFSMPPFAWWKEAKSILPSQLGKLQEQLVQQQEAHSDQMQLVQRAKDVQISMNGKVVPSDDEV